VLQDIQGPGFLPWGRDALGAFWFPKPKDSYQVRPGGTADISFQDRLEGNRRKTFRKLLGRLEECEEAVCLGKFVGNSRILDIGI